MLYFVCAVNVNCSNESGKYPALRKQFEYGVVSQYIHLRTELYKYRTEVSIVVSGCVVNLNSSITEQAAQIRDRI